MWCSLLQFLWWVKQGEESFQKPSPSGIPSLCRPYRLTISTPHSHLLSIAAVKRTLPSLQNVSERLKQQAKTLHSELKRQDQQSCGVIRGTMLMTLCVWNIHHL